MKKYITKEQYSELTVNQKRAAESYFRRQSEPKEHEFELFWNVGRMIEYLDEAAFIEMDTSTDTTFRWVNIYGCNLSGTLQEEWCDKLWEKVKSRLQEEVKADPHRFL